MSDPLEPNGSVPLEEVNSAAKANGLDRSPNILPEDEANRKFCKDVFVFSNQKAAVQDAKQHADRQGKALSAVITLTNKLWTRGTQGIKYGWAPDNSGTDIQRQKVRVSIQEWERYGEIHFYEVSPDTGNPGEIPDIVVGFDPAPSQGSWSLVGTDSAVHAGRGEATMNLGWLDPNSTSISDGERAVILHEVRRHKNGPQSGFLLT